MFLIFLASTLSQCQLQLNPISGYNFFYKKGNFSTYGNNLQVLLPNLGFQLQGGFIQGTLNQTLQIQNITSTSLLEQLNLIGILSLKSNYIITSVSYNTSGFQNSASYQTIRLNTALYSCQTQQIIGLPGIVVHCLNISSSQVTIVYFNQSVLYFDTGYSISGFGQVLSTKIQYYYFSGNLSIIFHLHLQLLVIGSSSNFIQQYFVKLNLAVELSCFIHNNICFIQIRKQLLINIKLVFALFQLYLLFQYRNYSVRYQNPKGLQFVNMYVSTDIDYDFVISMVDNEYVYQVSFQYRFITQSTVKLPQVISIAQIYSNLEYVIILTNQQTWAYQYQGNKLQLFLQSQQSSFNQFNQYSSISNLLVSINSAGIQLFQLTDYYLYNNKPNQTGYLKIGSSNFNNLNAQSLYINVLQNQSNQICPTQANFQGVSLQSYQSIQLFNVLSQYYVGPNLTYSVVNQTGSQVTFVLKQLSQISNVIQQSQAIYSISYLNALLIIEIQSTEIIFLLNQYNSITGQYLNIQQFKYKMEISGQQIKFIDYQNSTIMVLINSGSGVQAIELSLYTGVQNAYQIYIQPGQIETFQHYMISFYKKIVYVYQINTNDYSLISSLPDIQFNSIAGYQYGQQYLLFAYAPYLLSQRIYVYVWVYNTFQLLETLNPQLINLYIQSGDIYSVDDGIFFVYNSNQIIFYDKSYFLTTTLAKQYLYFQFTITIPYHITSSKKFLYISTRINSLFYINIYQGTSVQNTLYQSLYVSDNPTSFNVTTDLVNQYDYLSINIQTRFYYYIIPHQVVLLQFPTQQYAAYFNLYSTIQVSNGYNQELFQINYTISSTNPILRTVQSYIPGVYNQPDYSLNINPLNYFAGLIQDYSVSCQNCKDVSLTNIITNQVFYWNYSSFISVSQYINGVQNVYTLNLNSLDVFTLPFNQNFYGDVTNYISSITTFNQQNIPIYMFIEIQTNSLTWLVNEINALSIYTILANTTLQVNLTLSQFNASNQALYAIYNNGILQIVTNSYYYCFNYYLFNQTKQLAPILQDVQISVLTNQSTLSFLNVTNIGDKYVFGLQFQDIFYRYQFLLIELTIINGQYQFNSFTKFYPIMPNSFNNQNIIFMQQYGDPVQQQNTSKIQFIYSTNIFCGQFLVEFNGPIILGQQLLQEFQLINPTVLSNNINLIAQNGIQLAIMSYAQNSNNNINYLQIYQFGYTLPYAYIELPINSAQQILSLNYLSSNQLILSFNQQTFLINVNQFLTINYQASTNSTIYLMAQNLFNSANVIIPIYYSPKDNPANESLLSPFQKKVLEIVLAIGGTAGAIYSIWQLYDKCREKKDEKEKEIQIEQIQNDQL